MAYFCDEESGCYYLGTGAGDVKAVIAFLIELAYLQRCPLEQPLYCDVLAIVASSVKCGLAILVTSLGDKFRALEEGLEGLNISIGSCSDEGGIPIKIISIYLTVLYQLLCNPSLPHKDGNHQRCIPFFVPFLKVKIMMIRFYQL